MKALRIVFNKYVVTAALFGVWVYFFDTNDWNSQRRRERALEETVENIQFLNAEISRMEREYEALKSDPITLETVAREQYRMKRENEDVYMVPEE